ncbi:unnamed protein product [Cochlearia groenlandica]
MALTSLLHKMFQRRKKKSIEFNTNGFIRIFEFDFDTIRVATNDFSDIIGRGGFGNVYKGELQSGQEIAVKRFSGSNFNTFETMFRNEIEVLSNLRHKNLIQPLGFCSKQDQHFLVYEYMPNSCLDRFIFDPHRASQLNWEIFRNIIQGIARGLRYIHEESGLCVIHRDIKPSNILLDSDFKPKIGGFDLAKMMQQGESEAEPTTIAGTIGYLDPEYIRTGRVSFKTDVYAFEVTILNIISKRKAYCIEDEEPLIIFVMRCWKRGEAIDVIHETMRRDSISEILRYIHIALLCIDENPEIRPSLDKVIHWFSCESSLPLPEPTIGDQLLVEEERDWSSSPSLSPGHN